MYISIGIGIVIDIVIVIVIDIGIEDINNIANSKRIRTAMLSEAKTRKIEAKEEAINRETSHQPKKELSHSNAVGSKNPKKRRSEEAKVERGALFIPEKWRAVCGLSENVVKISKIWLGLVWNGMVGWFPRVGVGFACWGWFRMLG